MIRATIWLQPFCRWNNDERKLFGPRRYKFTYMGEVNYSENQKVSCEGNSFKEILERFNAEEIAIINMEGEIKDENN